MLLTTTRHIFSGICVCGHNADEHHGNCIAKQETIDLMQSSILFGECEHFGCNEDWEQCPTCHVGFVDKDDPLKDEKINNRFRL